MKRLDIEKLVIDYKLNSSNNKKLRDEIIKAYIKRIEKMAFYINKKVSFVEREDLINEGIIGLIKAIESYDINKGVKFITYATIHIRGYMLNLIRKNDWVPERQRAKSRKLRKAMDIIQQKFGRKPTFEELAKALDTDLDKIKELIANTGTSYLLSLDDNIYIGKDNNKVSISEKISTSDITPSEDIEFKEQREILWKNVFLLPEKEQQIIKMHYLEGKSFKEIADYYNVSRQRISQKHKQILKKLRKNLKKELKNE